MSDLFEANFYSDNRKRLRTLFQGTAPIVITANGLLQQGGDNTYKFHQDGSFYYLTGIDKPDVLLVIDKEKEYLILPEQDFYDNVFNGTLQAEEFTKISGITEVLDNKVGWKKLAARLKKVKHYATLAALPSYVESHSFYANPARAALIDKIKDINQSAEPLDLRQHLSIMRMVKQAPEIAAIQQAVDITIGSIKDLQRKLPTLDNEYQVEALLAYGFQKRGAEGHSFSPIVSSGANTCTMHYIDNNQPFQQGQLLLIDVGAQSQRYAADIARTYSIGGSPTKRQQAVHDAVMEVHQYALDNLKPGISIRENEKLVEQFMGEKLRSLGLIRNVERDEIRKFFPHATSHFLGLDVHDGGDYDRPLEPGVVLTVEPGIYIPSESLGIRVEDDVIITETGNQVMSAKLPRHL